MDKPIDITSDYVFKGIFKDASRAKDFLENILIGKGKILPEGTEITKLEYLPTEYIQEMLPELAKKTIFDLQITTTKGIFIIEMQKDSSLEYLKRVEFYSATAYANQQIKGSSSSMKDYTNALPIVTISVIKDKIFEDEVPCISYHINLEQQTQQQYMKALSYVFIELGKLNEQDWEILMNAEGLKDWLTLLKTQDLSHVYHNEKVNDAVRYVQYIRNNKYDEYIRSQIAEVAEQKAKEEAEAKGKQEGRVERNIEIARNLLTQNVDITIISNVTGLSLDALDKLKP